MVYYFHNLNLDGMELEQGVVAYCVFEDGTFAFTNAIHHTNSGTLIAAIFDNVIWLNSVAGVGIRAFQQALVMNNSIFNNAAGTGTGIIAATSNAYVLNNIVEGFSGVGGVGISYTRHGISGGNAGFNNETNFSTFDIGYSFGDDEALSVSAFVDAANKDFTIIDTGNIFAGAKPDAWQGITLTNFLDKGAFQREVKGGVPNLINARGLIQ